MTEYFIDIGNTRIKHAANSDPFQPSTCPCDSLSPLLSELSVQKPTKLLIISGRSKQAIAAKTLIIDYAFQHNITVVNPIVETEILPINYTKPEQFGIDRFLNLLAAQEKYEKNFCVVSAGTAITLDFYTNQHIGGMILLGLGSTKTTLVEKTGLSDIRKPKGLLGNDTASSIGAGIYIGLQNLIDRSIVRVSLAEQTPFKTIWTGGDAETLYSQGELSPTLLFEGMSLYHQRMSTV